MLTSLFLSSDPVPPVAPSPLRRFSITSLFMMFFLSRYAFIRGCFSSVYMITLCTKLIFCITKDSYIAALSIVICSLKNTPCPSVSYIIGINSPMVLRYSITFFIIPFSFRYSMPTGVMSISSKSMI